MTKWPSGAGGERAPGRRPRRVTIASATSTSFLPCSWTRPRTNVCGAGMICGGGAGGAGGGGRRLLLVRVVGVAEAERRASTGPGAPSPRSRCGRRRCRCRRRRARRGRAASARERVGAHAEREARGERLEAGAALRSGRWRRAEVVEAEADVAVGDAAGVAVVALAVRGHVDRPLDVGLHARERRLDGERRWGRCRPC